MEVGKSPDRTVATPNASFFGDRDSTDPDRQMIKVDKDALDRMVAEEQAIEQALESARKKFPTPTEGEAAGQAGQS